MEFQIPSQSSRSCRLARRRLTRFSMRGSLPAGPEWLQAEPATPVQRVQPSRPSSWPHPHESISANVLSGRPLLRPAPYHRRSHSTPGLPRMRRCTTRNSPPPESVEEDRPDHRWSPCPYQRRGLLSPALQTSGPVGALRPCAGVQGLSGPPGLWFKRKVSPCFVSGSVSSSLSCCFSPWGQDWFWIVVQASTRS